MARHSEKHNSVWQLDPETGKSQKIVTRDVHGKDVVAPAVERRDGSRVSDADVARPADAGA